MPSNLPLRTVRIPALQRQCLFQRRQPRAFSTTAPQSFASTPRLGRRTQLGGLSKSQYKAFLRGQVGPAPKINYDKAQEDTDKLTEDIGLLQHTMIRARMEDLPGKWRPAFWGYFWKLLKSKMTALYSRGAYNRCMYKEGFKSFLPTDRGKNDEITSTATRLYEEIYQGFARGDIEPIARHCLRPLGNNFVARLDARGPLQLDWKLRNINSATVVSHRAQPLGDSMPDTAFRQVVVRIDSIQDLVLSWQGGELQTTASKRSLSRALQELKWVPEEAKIALENEVEDEEEDWTMEDYKDNMKRKRVVEYIVLQKRVIRGKEEEDWKVWGFAQETTRERLEDDEVYWGRAMDVQAEQMGRPVY